MEPRPERSWARAHPASMKIGHLRPDLLSNPLISPPRVLARQPENQRPKRLVQGRSARPAAGPCPAGPLPSDELTVPAEHGLGHHEEGAPGLPRQVAARGGQQEAGAATATQ